MKLSAYLITLNEEKHLAQVLSRLQGVDEIIVVDSGSTDQTIAIARQFGATVVHQDWLGFAKQKAYAMSLCQGEWVLCVDGDEVFEEQAVTKMRKAIHDSAFNGFRVKRAEVLLGKPMRAGRLELFLRLYKKNQAQWNTESYVHEFAVVNGKIGTLDIEMVHYGADTITMAIEKINRYSSLKAAERIAKGKNPSLLRLLGNPWLFFVRNLIFRGYLLNGLSGLAYATIQAFYAFAVEIKIFEQQRLH